MSDRSLQVGELAPEFTAVTDSGATVRLADFRGKRVILYFYPKGGRNSSSEPSFCR